MSADFLNIFSPAKEICFPKRNRTEITGDIEDICAILRVLECWPQPTGTLPTLKVFARNEVTVTKNNDGMKVLIFIFAK